MFGPSRQVALAAALAPAVALAVPLTAPLVWSAHAGSCGSSFVVRPAGGGAPRNAVVTSYVVWGGRPEFTVVAADTGTAIPGTASEEAATGFDHLVTFRPDARLAADTRYEVRAFGESIGTFTTGRLLDETHPVAPALSTVTARIRRADRGRA